MRRFCFQVAWKNSRHLATLLLVSPQLTSEKRAQKFHTDDASLPRSGWCFWLVESNFPRGTSNQKHQPDLGSDASSVSNFCARFSDVIWRGKQWWCCELWAVFLGYLSSSLWETDAQIFISFRFSWMPKRYYRWGGVVPYSWREQGYQTLSKWGSRYVKEITSHSGYQQISFLLTWVSK